MKRRALKLLFWLLLLVSVIGAPINFTPSFGSILTLLGTVLTLAALFGFSYEKALLHPVVWKAAFFVNLAVWLRAIALGTQKALLLGWSTLDIGFFVLVSAGLGVFVLSLHFAYAFRCHGIWSQSPSKA